MVQASATSMTMDLMANPVRKVVNMMQRMSKQIEDEGKVKEEMFNAFMCYCKDGGAGIGAGITAAEEKIPQVESSIKENTGGKAQLEADLKTASADRTEATATLDKAKAIREKEASDYAAEAAESKANIAALARAIPAIEQGTGAAFIQANTGITEKLRQLSVSIEMEAVDRDLLASFLTDGSTTKGSGEILGILKQMQDEMNKDLADSTAQEQTAASEYESLVGAKNKQKTALTKAIETKTVRVGELAVALAQSANDLEDTEEGLVEDKKLLANLATSCKTKAGEWDAYKKSMSEELVALADTIKLLNDDDALDLFKKTLPSAASSFMQVQVTAKSMQRRALQMLRKARKHHRGQDHRLDFLEMALHGGQMGFDKILKMVDDLMAVLSKEQADDDSKKAYCHAETDKNEDAVKALTLDISDLGKAIGDGKETMKSSAKEIVDLTQGIKALDRSVAEATATRKKENTDYVKTLAENSAAKDLLGMAKNRLNKFYNAALHKPAPQSELLEEDAASFVQVHSASQHRQPAADFTSKKKGEESTGVIAMIDILIADVSKNNQILELEEKDGQSTYETFMGDAKTKRALDAKAITDKESAKAGAEAALQENKLASKDKSTELQETNKFLMGLHQECDWLLKFYETRKTARSDEIESLDKAKSVLNGADYSFLQTATMRLRGSK